MPWWNRRRSADSGERAKQIASRLRRWKGGGVRVPPRQAYFLRRPLRRTIKHVSETGFSQTPRKFAKCKNLCPLAASRPSNWAPRRHSCGKNCAHLFLNFFIYAQIENAWIPLSFQINSPDFCKLDFHANMKHQLLVVLLCVSCGASALGTSIPAVSTLNFTDFGAAHGYGTYTTAKIRKRRYISQNDMLAILDYHNKVRGRVFPPAANMEYMVSGSPAGMNEVFMCAQGDNWCTDCAASDHQNSRVRKEGEVMCITTITRSALTHLCTSHNE